jgi:neutral ceramidase
MRSSGMKVGLGRADVTGPICRVGMMGYAIAHQQVEGVTTRLHARAYAMEDRSTGARLAFVSAEVWSITQSIRQGVMNRLATDYPGLGLGEQNVMLTATHTHSGPGGYSQYVLFNLSIPGYVEPILRAIVDGIVSALVDAVEGLAPGSVSLQRGEIPDDEPVGFNRAIKAYNRNSDVEPVSLKNAHMAIDREMTTLRFDGENGDPLGAISWFGVHGTSLHSDNHHIHSDNKGLAATAFEHYAGEEWNAAEFTAAFAQTTAGDVTPNFRWNAKRRFSLGSSDDDLESARENADIQFRQARKLFEACATPDQLSPTLRAACRYVDFADLAADTDLAHGVKGARTGSATLGISLAMGTGDGPGPLYKARFVPWFLNRSCALYNWLRKLFRGRVRVDASTPQGNKFPFMQVGRGRHGRVFGLFSQARPPVPGGVDPTVARLKVLGRRDALGDKPWTPQFMPVQLFVVGSFVIVALPFEPTTVSGRRIRRVTLEALAPLGVSHAVVSGYANAYGGYLTTREEYQVQDYEGASNYAGQWTLAATLTELRRLARDLVVADTPTLAIQPDAPRPPVFTDAELAIRAWESPPQLPPIIEAS